MEELTDHSEERATLQRKIEWCEKFEQVGSNLLETQALRLAVDLLQAHDDTGISLDNWWVARDFVENLLGSPIRENGV